MKADIIATRNYYQSLSPTDLCDCGYCKTYYRQIRTACPEAASFLDGLGVDIEKPFETSPLEPDPEGFLEYCGCQYIVFGTCPTDYTLRLAEITFRVTSSHPHTGIEAEHFVLEFYPVKLRYSYG